MDIFNNPTAFESILLSVVAGVLLLGIQGVSKVIYGSIQRVVSAIQKDSYEGYWLSTYNVQFKGCDDPVYDLFKIKQKGERLYFTCWHYASWYEKKNCYIYFGEGVRKSNFISAYYYLNDKLTPETGCYVLRQEGARLVGMYVQYSQIEGQSGIKNSQKKHTLKRVSIPLLNRVKVLLGFPVFSSYEAASKISNREALVDE